MITFKLKGLDKALAKIEKKVREVESKISPALRLEAELIMTDSKQHYVPIDEGKLKSSGVVGNVRKTGNTYKVKLSYGGISAPYALAIHEHLSRHSPPSWKKAKVVRFHPTGRGPKYLEIPLVKSAKGIERRMAKHLRG